MRVITMNIQGGKRADGTIGDLVAVGREVAAYQPDIVAVQELDYHQHRSGWRDQLADLAEGLGYPAESTARACFFSGQARSVRLPSLTFTPGNTWPKRLGSTLHAAAPTIGGFGVGVLTPHPITRVMRARLGAAPPRIRRTSSGGIAGTGWTAYMGQNRTLLGVEVDVDGQSTRVGVAHLELGTATARAQLRRAWGLLNNDFEGVALLAGDMNLPASAVREVTGVDAALDATAPTFPVTNPTSAIDHVLAAGPIRLAKVQTTAVSVGDHRALIADFDAA